MSDEMQAMSPLEKLGLRQEEERQAQKTANLKARKNVGWKPGQSGNPKGRTKGVPLTDEVRAQFDSDPFGALIWLMKTAKTRQELRTAALDLMPYVKAALKSIEITSHEDKKISIQLLPPSAEALPEAAALKIAGGNRAVIDLEPVAIQEAMTSVKEELAK